MNTTQKIDDWELSANERGELMIGGCSSVDLAREYETPLHVVNDSRLEKAARGFRQIAESLYPGKVSVHYPFKCNSVPGVVETIHKAGLQAEVMTDFELELALRLGYDGSEIIVNGPCKTEDFLRKCLDANVRFIIIDALEELSQLERIARSAGRCASVLLRVNPDYVPRGMNQGSATGSRKGCAFGLDWRGGEVQAAIARLGALSCVQFQGFHFHLGTGIADPRDYSNALRCLPLLLREAHVGRLDVRVVDVGGGFAARTTREFSTKEMLLYQGLGKLPSGIGKAGAARIDQFAQVISDKITKSFGRESLPELIYEPGRCITSSNQLLLLTIHRVKERRGIGTWLITDGGLGTVTLPTFYEYHEVFLANDVRRPRRESVSLIGPACFAGDVIYRNKKMPRVQAGDVIALMDTGAYFTALESSFGFARPAIVSARDGVSRLIRVRESFDEMIARDRFAGEIAQTEELS